MPATTPNHLIVWVDGTPESANGLHYAINQALESDDTLTLVSSMDRPALVILEAMQINTDHLLRELRDNVISLWGQPASAAGLAFHTHTGRGDGADVLIGAARDHQLAMIIVGAGSSVTPRLIHHHRELPCPVIAVPGTPHPTP